MVSRKVQDDQALAQKCMPRWMTAKPAMLAEDAQRPMRAADADQEKLVSVAVMRANLAISKRERRRLTRMLLLLRRSRSMMGRITNQTTIRMTATKRAMPAKLAQRQSFVDVMQTMIWGANAPATLATPAKTETEQRAVSPLRSSRLKKRKFAKQPKLENSSA